MTCNIYHSVSYTLLDIVLFYMCWYKCCVEPPPFHVRANNEHSFTHGKVLNCHPDWLTLLHSGKEILITWYILKFSFHWNTMGRPLFVDQRTFSSLVEICSKEQGRFPWQNAHWKTYLSVSHTLLISLRLQPSEPIASENTHNSIVINVPDPSPSHISYQQIFNASKCDLTDTIQSILSLYFS